MIKAGPADAIALAFYQLGYRPRESLLVIGVHGARQRLGVLSRVDLPPSRHRRRIIGQQLALLRREREDSLVALVVSDAESPASSTHPVPLPHRALARELRRQADRAGLKVVDVIAVGPTTWRSYLCPGGDCCPPEGNSLEAAFSGPAAVELVALGQVLADDPSGLLADVEPVPGTGRPPSRPRDPRPTRLGRDEALRALERWRELLAEPSAAGTDDIAELSDVLRDRTVRDALLLSLSPAAGSVPEEVLDGAEPPDLDEAFGAEPDRDLLERGRVLLSAVARSAPTGRRADALALLAWSAWWVGQGTRGRLLAERALADVPGHRLATLIDRVLCYGIVPPWIERRRLARTPAGDDGPTEWLTGS